MIGSGLFFHKTCLNTGSTFTLHCVYENTHQLMNTSPVTVQDTSLNCFIFEPQLFWLTIFKKFFKWVF